jgi:glycosyltransferase involved in cell wall biosynthesis
MNLHIVPDNTFINAFHDNLDALGLLPGNRIVVRTNNRGLTAIKHDIPYARLYSKTFEKLVGETPQYDRVFIHYFTPLLYRWVARHSFKELNWMVWGGDLYNLPGIDHSCYEAITLDYIQNDRSMNTLLYHAKVILGHRPFLKAAYRKVKNILTWMPQEYEFACDHLPVEATHQFFFYENQQPYQALDGIKGEPPRSERLTLLLGNSGTPSNNHLDAVRFLSEHRIKADLVVPVSYGDRRYISFLRKNLHYAFGKVTFVDQFLPFEDYVKLLASADALVMNTIRPMGYGNILMMLYMGKPVFLNPRNTSLSALEASGIICPPLSALPGVLTRGMVINNRHKVVDLLSHERLLSVYKKLFDTSTTEV